MVTRPADTSKQPKRLRGESRPAWIQRIVALARERNHKPGRKQLDNVELMHEIGRTIDTENAREVAAMCALAKLDGKRMVLRELRAWVHRTANGSGPLHDELSRLEAAADADEKALES
jgi:hypothetical protein